VIVSRSAADCGTIRAEDLARLAKLCAPADEPVYLTADDLAPDALERVARRAAEIAVELLSKRA
jgi:hypothetical protein